MSKFSVGQSMRFICTFFLAVAVFVISAVVVLPSSSFEAQATSQGYHIYTWGNDLAGALLRATTGEGISPNNRPGRAFNPPRAASPPVGTANAPQGPVWVASSTNQATTIAIHLDGYLHAWGVQQNFPNGGRIGTANNWISVASGHVNAAINSEGVIYTWNSGVTGYLGPGRTGAAGSPQPIDMPPSGGTWAVVHPGTGNAVRSAPSGDPQQGTQGGLYLLAITNEGLTSDGVPHGYLYAAGTGARIIPHPTNPDLYGTTSATWVRIGNANNWVDVTSTDHGAAALNASGEIHTWGDGIAGAWIGPSAYPPTVNQLGRGATSQVPMHRPAPIEPHGPAGSPTSNNWTSLAGGTSAFAAVHVSGRIYTWGGTAFGFTQPHGRPLGAAHPDGAPANRPGRVGTDANWIRVIANGTEGHFLAFNGNGYLYGWGLNSNGQIGPVDNPSLTPVLTPMRIMRAISTASTDAGNTNSAILMRALAAEGEFNLYKHLQKPEGTPAPNLTFTFTVERNSFNGESTPADIARIPVIGSITLNPTTVVNPNAPNPAPAGIITLQDYANILDGIIFEETGIFSWIISEVQSATGIGPDSTVVFSQAEYELRVYVFREHGPLGDYYVRFITLHRILEADGTIPDVENGRRKVNNLIFENQYTYDFFVTPTGLFLRSGSLYLVVFAVGVVLTTYLSLRARKRIEELPIMQ